MSLEVLLKARTVCKAWADVWGSYVQGLSLEQPMSVPAARNMGRKAAAAFPGVSTVRISLVRTGPEASLDLTSSDDAVELPMKPAERPQAAKALVQQLQKLVHLRRVHFSDAHIEALAALVHLRTLKHKLEPVLTESSGEHHLLCQKQQSITCCWSCFGAHIHCRRTASRLTHMQALKLYAWLR